MITKYTRLMIFIIALQIFLSGCSSKPDSDLVGNEKCSPPCWMGIQPGKTSDAIQLLKGIETEGEGTLTILDTGILKRLNNSNKNYYLYTDGELIVEVEIYFHSSRISLDEAISLFGEPSYISLDKISDGDYFISAYYPDKGIVLVAGGDKSLYEVYPSMPIFSVHFLHPNDITTIVSLLYGKNSVSEALANIQVWNKYGIYNK